MIDVFVVDIVLQRPMFFVGLFCCFFVYVRKNVLFFAHFLNALLTLLMSRWYCHWLKYLPINIIIVLIWWKVPILLFQKAMLILCVRAVLIWGSFHWFVFLVILFDFFLFFFVNFVDLLFSEIISLLFLFQSSESDFSLINHQILKYAAGISQKNLFMKLFVLS